MSEDKLVLKGRVMYYDKYIKEDGKEGYVFIRVLTDPGTTYKGRSVTDFGWYPEEAFFSPWIFTFDDLESAKRMYDMYSEAQNKTINPKNDNNENTQKHISTQES